MNLRERKASNKYDKAVALAALVLAAEMQPIGMTYNEDVGPVMNRYNEALKAAIAQYAKDMEAAKR